MINLTPNYIEIIPARDKIQLPITTQEFDLAQLFGGWQATQNELRKGSINIKAKDEQILAGSATAPLTGTGLFFGKDGANYEFRCGNPSGNYFHYDGTDLAFVGGSLTVGTNAWHVDTSGNMWWGSSSTYAAATIRISAAGAIESSSIKTVGTGARVEIGVGGTNVIDIYSASAHQSSVTGLDNELRLYMEQAGGYITLYAQNDADSAIEVLKVDGDAGVTIGGDLPLTGNRVSLTNSTTNKSLYVYHNITSGTNPVVEIDNDGQGKSLNIGQANAANANQALSITNAGTGTGLYVDNTKTDASGVVLYAISRGLGHAAAFYSLSTPTNRQNATIGIYPNTLRNAHIHFDPGASTPANPTEGDLYSDTDGSLYYHNGTAFQALVQSDGDTGGSGSAGSGNQYVELDIGGTVYKVLHDGTV